MPMHPVRQDFPGALYSTPVRARDWRARGLPAVPWQVRHTWHLLRAASELAEGAGVRLQELNDWLYDFDDGSRTKDGTKTIRGYLQELERAGLARQSSRRWHAVMPGEEGRSIDRGNSLSEPKAGQSTGAGESLPGTGQSTGTGGENRSIYRKNRSIDRKEEASDSGRSTGKTGQSTGKTGQSTGRLYKESEKRRETSSSAPVREAPPEQPERAEPRGDDDPRLSGNGKTSKPVVTRPAQLESWSPLAAWEDAERRFGLRPDEVPSEERLLSPWLDLAATTATWHQLHQPTRQKPIANPSGYRATVRDQFRRTVTAALEAVEVALDFARARRSRIEKQERESRRQAAQIEVARERSLTEADRDYDHSADPLAWLGACRPELMRRLKRATASEPHLLAQWERQASQQWGRGDGSRLAVEGIREAVLHRLFLVLGQCEQPRERRPA